MSHPDAILVSMKAHPRSVYRRRRVVAAFVLVALLTALTMGVLSFVHWAGSGALATELPAEQGLSERMLPVSEHAYVVRQGDTLWSIARALQPEGDVRPLVHRLSHARRGTPLRPGERILLP